MLYCHAYNIQDGVNVEGARMWEACGALRDCLLQLGVGIDGGKDSLTMAAKVYATSLVFAFLSQLC
jgi:hypothetical protein